MQGFLFGLDLGQANDYTAAVIVQAVKAEDRRHFHVRHVQRWPLGTPYTAIVNEVAGQLAAPELRGNTRLIIDRTGVGRAVFDLFAAIGVRELKGITITGGENHHPQPGGWSVPKKDLAGVLQATLGTGRLKFAAELPERDVLRQELQSFEVRITTAGHAQYAADWRSGQHDDVVLALACALWYGDVIAPRPANRFPRSMSYRTI